MLKDNSGKIDFVAWGPNGPKVKESLTVGETYKLYPLKVNSCIPRFCHTPSLLQLTFTNETEIDLLDVSPFEDIIDLTPLGDLPQNTLVNVNISGKITNVFKDTGDTNDKTVVVLRDDDTSIKLSLYGAAGQAFKGNKGDVIVFENVIVKNYGACYLINATNALYTLNPKSDHLKFLYEIAQEKPISVNLSPEKKKATQIKCLDSLMENNTLQEVMAEPIEVIMDCYHSCPALGCKKKMKENEKSNTYSCDKCNRIYVASATGLCAKVLVSANNAVKTFTFFNDIAEKFFNMKGKDIISEGVSSEKLLETVQNQYIFTVSGGRKDNEFLVTKFRKVAISHTQTTEEPPMPVKNKKAQPITIPKNAAEPESTEFSRFEEWRKNNTAQQNSLRNKVKPSVKRLLSTTGFEDDVLYTQTRKEASLLEKPQKPELMTASRISNDKTTPESHQIQVPHFDSTCSFSAPTNTMFEQHVASTYQNPMTSPVKDYTKFPGNNCAPLLNSTYQHNQIPIHSHNVDMNWQNQDYANPPLFNSMYSNSVMRPPSVSDHNVHLSDVTSGSYNRFNQLSPSNVLMKQGIASEASTGSSKRNFPARKKTFNISDIMS